MSAMPPSLITQPGTASPAYAGRATRRQCEAGYRRSRARSSLRGALEYFKGSEGPGWRGVIEGQACLRTCPCSFLAHVAKPAKEPAIAVCELSGLARHYVLGDSANDAD